MAFKIPAMLGAALVAVACSTPPATAQYGYGYGHDYGYGRGYGHGFGSSIDDEQARIMRRINRGLQRGFLTRNEYNNLMARYNQLAALEAQYMTGGLTWRERRQLSDRLHNLQFMLNRDWSDRQRDWRYSGRPRWWY